MAFAISFDRWEFALLVAGLVIAGAILAAALIGRALRWKAGLEDARRKREK